MSIEPQGPQPGDITPDEFEGQRRFWHLDFCQNAVFAPAIRDSIDYPSPGGTGSKGFEPGFFELRSTHPVRAVEVHDPGGDEVCSFHHGKMSMGVDGFARPIFCSLPFALNAKDFSQVTALRTFIRPATDVHGNPQNTWQGIEPGFFGFVGAYHAPYWTEAVFHSHVTVCGLGDV
jgi:hypothetical protein